MIQKKLVKGLAEMNVIDSKNSIVVVSRYDEDISWTKELEKLGFECRIYEKENPKSKYNIEKNMGNEASVYIKFIIDNYENLPEYSILLHGHEFSWHSNKENDSVVDLVKKEIGEKYEFKNLNDVMMTSWFLMSGVTEVRLSRLFRDWYKEYIEYEIGPLRNFGDFCVGFPCCAQFIVHKNTIMKREKKFYQKIYDWIMKEIILYGDDGTKPNGTAILVEYAWHLFWEQVPKKSQEVIRKEIKTYKKWKDLLLDQRKKK